MYDGQVAHPTYGELGAECQAGLTRADEKILYVIRSAGDRLEISYPALAQRSQTSLSSVERAVAKLKRKKLIRVRPGTGRRHPSVFEAVKLTPFNPPQPTSNTPFNPPQEPSSTHLNPPQDPSASRVESKPAPARVVIRSNSSELDKSNSSESDLIISNHAREDQIRSDLTGEDFENLRFEEKTKLVDILADILKVRNSEAKWMTATYEVASMLSAGATFGLIEACARRMAADGHFDKPPGYLAKAVRGEIARLKGLSESPDAIAAPLQTNHPQPRFGASDPVANREAQRDWDEVMAEIKREVGVA